MNRNDINFLLAEKIELQHLLAEIPEEDVIDRGSFQARLNQVEAQLAKAPACKREPAQARLTFRGRPVVGSYGIYVKFGADILDKFTKAIALLATGPDEPLSASGPIPDRRQNDLLLTGAAIGSFGFELEESPSEELPNETPSPVGLALEQAQALIQGTLGTDDELADAVSGANPRAIAVIRAFLKTLADEEAVCALEYKGHTTRFEDVGQVKRSMERLSENNLLEEEAILEGEFQGVLPKRRTFEFMLFRHCEIITGKVGPCVNNPGELNKLLHCPVKIRAMVTRVGNGRPRYQLLAMPEVLDLSASNPSIQ